MFSAVLVSRASWESGNRQDSGSEAVTPYRTVRIFLSSTFRDFDEERRLLVEEVFPALRERLRERLVELVDVDLRWGITAQEAEQGRVLSICLEEVEQCRPYFIGLLGERYGWVPARDSYPQNLTDVYPWLDEHRGVASVTELEIRYGVLDRPEMHSRALFFFRDAAYAALRGSDFESKEEVDRSRQSELKSRIRRSGLPVFEYGDPQALARVLGEKLWALLDAEFPLQSTPDAYELEHQRHLSFGAANLGGFVRDAERHGDLLKLMEEGHQRILITGRAGMGKSAVLADLYRSGFAADAIVFYHSLEASEDASKADFLLQRLLEFIRRQTGSDAVMPAERSAILKALPEWLVAAHDHAQRKKVRWVILLDGLDRLRTERGLLWLPTFLPDSVRLIVGCRPGPTQSVLRRRGDWQSLELKSMSSAHRSAVLKKRLSVFNKNLEESQSTAILGHKWAGQPLFLCTLIEELRIFGSYEGLQRRLDELISCATLDDLYEKMLARLEANHDPVCVRRALSALCLSQYGMTEPEILDFSGLTYQARWSPLRLALGNALSRSSGRVRPANDYLRKAVKDRYYPEAGIERDLRMDFACWLGERPLDSPRALEQSAQLALAGQHRELMRLLSDRRVFGFLHRVGGNNRLTRYWLDLELAIGVDPSTHYSDCWLHWRSDMDPAERLDISARMQGFLRFLGRQDSFELQIARDRLQDCRDIFGETDIRHLRQAGAYAQSLSYRKEHLGLARKIAQEVCTGVERIVGPESMELAGQLRDLATICRRDRDYEAGIAAARRALRIAEVREGHDHASLVPYLNTLTDLLLPKARCVHGGDSGSLKGNKKFGESIALQLRCIKILRTSYGLRHLQGAYSAIRVGHLLRRAGRLTKALSAYQEALSARTALLGETHPLTKTAAKLVEQTKG